MILWREVVDSQVKGHYLPHHGVAKESKRLPCELSSTRAPNPNLVTFL